MNEAHYTILFSGELIPGASVESVKDNLARLFKTDRARVERLFGASEVALKRHLRSDEADRYLAALQRAGAQARKEPESHPLQLPEARGEAVADQPRMSCPKCGHTQAQHTECSACGIVIAKFLARQAQQAHEAPPFASVARQSPYAPPQAMLETPLPSHGELRVFSVQGRIGRLRYLAWSLVVVMAAAGLFGIASIVMAISSTAGILLMALLAVAALVVNVQIGAQRLHDIGVSSWLLLLNLVPLIGAFVPLLMMLIPGKGGPNRYGPPQPPNSLAVKVLAALWLLLVIGGVLVAITVPAATQYLHGAG
ncbi:membrane protein [Stutzerimonas stutzeri TS44]|nr:membrane protein [Stutzerimonas stutzeri TS44]